jgi:hypothetical protein
VATYGGDVEVCDRSTDCDEAADWDSVTVGGTLPQLAWDGVDRIFLAADDATGRSCHLSTGCTNGGDWTATPLVPNAPALTSSTSVAAVARGPTDGAVSTVYSYQHAASDYRFLYRSCGYDPSLVSPAFNCDDVILRFGTTPQQLPVPQLSRVSAGDAVQAVSAVLGDEIYVMTCVAAPASCASVVGVLPPNWGFISLGKVDFGTPVALDIDVAFAGRITVAYAHRRQVRIAGCDANCGDRASWVDGIAHVDPGYVAPGYNARFLSANATDDLLIGTSREFPDKKPRLMVYGQWSRDF